MKYKIIGNTVPAVQCILNKGEKMCTQSGGMVWMSTGFNYKSTMKDGLLNGIGRKFRGESVFLTVYEAKADEQLIAFGSTLPGSIKEIQISPNREFICQKTAFLCSQFNVKTEVCFTKRFSAGMFGGDGLILQKLKGEGMAFLEISGDVQTFDLLAGQSIYVDTGCLVGFEATVDFNIEAVKGLKNVLFSGEGMFLTKLTGPGSVYLQTQNIKDFARRLQSNMSMPNNNN